MNGKTFKVSAAVVVLALAAFFGASLLGSGNSGLPP